MCFSDKVRMARKERGLLMEELASRMGVSVGAISQWEAGNRTPLFANLLRLAEVLDKPISFFLDGEDNPPEPIIED